MVPYIFVHAKIFCNNIVTYICKLCLYNVYLAFLCQMNWFSNLMIFYFLFLCVNIRYIVFVCLNILLFTFNWRLFTFLCGRYCFWFVFLETINRMMQRSMRDDHYLCMWTRVAFLFISLRDKKQCHVFARNPEHYQWRYMIFIGVWITETVSTWTVAWALSKRQPQNMERYQ